MGRLIQTLILVLFPLWTYSQCSKVDIMIVGDMSGSVHGHEHFVTDAIYGFVSGLTLNEMRVGLIKFNSTTELYPLTNDISTLNFDWHPAYSTHMDTALQLASMQYDRDALKILILISDGLPDSPENAIVVANQLKMVGIRIFGIFIKQPEGEEFMRQISDVYLESDYNGLLMELKKLNFCL